jgi:[ribosomal protein S5]-alanine N-acetyltransferase
METQRMSGRIVIETERLYLREFASEDAEAVFKIGSDPVVQKYTGDPCLKSVEEAKAMLRKRPIDDYRYYGFGRWAVVLKATSKLIGMAGLKFLPEFIEVDVGYRLLPEFWGLGLATEASQASVTYGMESLKLTRIIGFVHPLNIASVRVLEKSGLTFEKMVEINSQQTSQFAIHARVDVVSNGHRQSEQQGRAFFGTRPQP